jgi:hypothetical protein
MAWLMQNPVLVHSEMVLVSEQDRCMVCAKRNLGLEIILDAPETRLKSRLVSIDLEIVLILT